MSVLFSICVPTATAKGLCSYHNVLCLFHTFPARDQSFVLCLTLHMLSTLEIVAFLPPGSYRFALNNWTGLSFALTSLMSPTPLSTTGPRTVLQTTLSTAQKGCHFLPPHTKPVIPPGPQTRNNYLQNHAWVFKHAPSSCGHSICRILLSPKSFHQTKVQLFLSKLPH